MPSTGFLQKSRRIWRKRELAAKAAFNKAHARRVLRDRQLKKARHAPAKGVRWALSRVGTVEHPAGSNSGPQITGWNLASIGVDHIPWCQSFANAVLLHGGGSQLKSAFTPTVVQWAREAKFGLKIVAFKDLRVGDFVFYKWPGVSHDFCDHVGVYAGNGKTVEGNTSPGNTGSQNNGGGVFLRQRGAANVVACVRPTYHH
jgi:hypothetical protein